MRLRIARWASNVAEPRGWLLVGVVYVTAVVLNIRRLWQFGPDSVFYLAWAYRYGGLSEQEAGHRTYEFLTAFSWFQPFCWNACSASPDLPYDWLFHGQEGGLVAPRVLYPLLSAPFVRIFGPYGMLIVPLIAYTVCVILVLVLASRLVGRRWSALAGVAVVAPISISAYATYAYTDALAMALCVACMLTLPVGRNARRRDLALFAVFLLLFAFTRQFHPIIVAGVGLAWLAAAVSERRLRNQWLPFLAVAVGLTLVVAYVQSRMGPDYSAFTWFLQYTGANTVSGIPSVLPRVIRDIIVGEIFVAGRDFGLVLVAILGTLGIVTRWRDRFSVFTVGVLVGTFLVQLLNAAPSQNRYWATAVPLLAVAATVFVAGLFDPDAIRPGAAPKTVITQPAEAAVASRRRVLVRQAGPPAVTDREAAEQRQPAT